MANEQFRGLGKLGPKGPEANPMGGMKAAAPKPAAKEAPMPESGDGKQMTVHDHGDGTFHTEAGGQHEEHPDLLHMTTHIAHHHAPESKHHHSSHDGFSHQTHGVSEDGQHQGTNEHESTDDAANEMKSFMGGGEEDQGAEHGAEHEEPVPMGGM